MWQHHPKLLVLVSALAWISSGCSSEPAELVKVRGMVTYRGRPQPGVAVLLVPVGENGTVARGVTDKDGRYTVQHESERCGAEAGDYKVLLRVFSAAASPEGREELSFSGSPSAIVYLTSVTPGRAAFDFELDPRPSLKGNATGRSRR